MPITPWPVPDDSEDKKEIVIKGGHVSLVAGGNAVYRLWPQLDRWLSTRSL